MTTIHLVLRYTHISMAMVGLVSGAAAMTGETGWLEIALALLGLATALAGINFGIQAANSPNGTLHAFPFQGYFVFGGAALLGAALDLRMIVRGGFSGPSRLTRHLSRMCFAFFMARRRRGFGISDPSD